MPNDWEGNHGLASHWPCITDLSGLSTYGLNGLVREMVTLPVLSKELGWLLDKRVSLDILGIQSLFYPVLFSAASEPVAKTIENYHRDCKEHQQLSAGSVLPPDIFMKLQFGGDSRVSFVFFVIIMVALCNRADHYIFALWFLSLFFFLLFFPRLISVLGEWMSTILPHTVWP